MANTISRMSYEMSGVEENLLIKQLREMELDNHIVAQVLVIIDEICHHCWDRPAGCQCWNDE